jgi:hypothetical protein
MKVNFVTTPVKYTESLQVSTTTFSFVTQTGDGEFTELFWPVKCRDFLGDVVYTSQTGTPRSIYRFKFAGKIDDDACKLVVHFGDLAELSRFYEGITILLDIEKENGLKPTQSHQVSENALLLIGDAFWQSKVWLISLYTHLIRCASSSRTLDSLFKEVDYRPEENYMQAVGKTKWNKLTKNLRKWESISTHPSGWNKLADNISSLHNSSGFRSLFASRLIGNSFSEAFHAV